MNLKSLQLDNIVTTWGRVSVDSYLGGTSLAHVVWLLWQGSVAVSPSFQGSPWPEFPRITIDGPQWTLPDENS